MPRIIGIDIARFLAIVGMMAAHLLYARGEAYPFSLDWLETPTSGFPSTLFAVLGGFGLFFTSREYLANNQRLAAAVNIAARGITVLAIGLLMELLPDHPIAVILVFFGAAILLCAPLILLPSPALVAIALLLALPVSLFGYSLQESFASGGILDATTVSEAIVILFLTGYYPVTTWIVYLLIGLLAARYLFGAKNQSDKGSDTHQQSRNDSLASPEKNQKSLVLLAFGLVAFTVGTTSSHFALPAAKAQLANDRQITLDFAQTIIATSHRGTPLTAPPLNLLLAAPHSGSPADILRTAGMAIALTALLIFVTNKIKTIPLGLKPIVAAGAAPLSVYSIHVILTSLTWTAVGFSNATWDGHIPWWYHYEFWLQIAIVLLFGTALAITGRRGPLEKVVSDIASRFAEKTTEVRATTNR